MSLLPTIFSHWWEDLEYPHHVFDQHFGLPLNYDDLLDRHNEHAFRAPRRFLHRHYHPYERSLMRRPSSGMSTVVPSKDKFQVSLSVQHFTPEEVTVKVVDRQVVIEAKHEEKQDDHGWISRQFTRKYMIPEQCNIDELTSTLSSDGVLTVTAPRKELPKTGEKVIKIQHTGQPALKDEAYQKSIEAQKGQSSQSHKASSTAQQRGTDKTVKAA